MSRQDALNLVHLRFGSAHNLAVSHHLTDLLPRILSLMCICSLDKMNCTNGENMFRVLGGIALSCTRESTIRKVVSDTANSVLENGSLFDLSLK